MEFHLPGLRHGRPNERSILLLLLRRKQVRPIPLVAINSIIKLNVYFRNKQEALLNQPEAVQASYITQPVKGRALSINRLQTKNTSAKWKNIDTVKPH